MTLNQMLKTLMEVLADRARVLLTLLLTFGLFAYASFDPYDGRTIIAVAFAVIVFLPVLFRERNRRRVANAEDEQQAA